MNLRCKVCGEKAAGFHFGAFTCEGCKSFFGRCCNNMSLIGECRNNKECVIDKKNRTSCKACRLRKCLTVGMSKNGSRYGRRSNWFKQFFQEAEQHANLSKKLASEAADDQDQHQDQHQHAERRRADALLPSSPTLFAADESDRKMCTDLYSSTTSVSSHLYFSYFPQYRLNRLVSYGDGRSSKIWLPANSTVPITFLDNRVRAVNDYVDRLSTEQRCAAKDCPSEHENDHTGVNKNKNADDPLDLSRKRSNCAENVVHHVADTKKNSSPLDLSIK